MNLPTTIRIGPIDFTVKLYDDMPYKNDDPDILSMGRYIEHKSEIALWSGLDEQSQFVTLWHEILHAVFEQRGIPHDESYITALAYGMLELLRDNTELVKASLQRPDVTRDALKKMQALLGADAS